MRQLSKAPNLRNICKDAARLLQCLHIAIAPNFQFHFGANTTLARHGDTLYIYMAG